MCYESAPQRGTRKRIKKAKEIQDLQERKSQTRNGKSQPASPPVELQEITKMNEELFDLNKLERNEQLTQKEVELIMKHFLTADNHGFTFIPIEQLLKYQNLEFNTPRFITALVREEEYYVIVWSSKYCNFQVYSTKFNSQLDESTLKKINSSVQRYIEQNKIKCSVGNRQYFTGYFYNPLDITNNGWLCSVIRRMIEFYDDRTEDNYLRHMINLQAFESIIRLHRELKLRNEQLLKEETQQAEDPKQK